MFLPMRSFLDRDAGQGPALPSLELQLLLLLLSWEHPPASVAPGTDTPTSWLASSPHPILIKLSGGLGRS